MPSVAAVVLAVVFTAAAVSKLRDRPATVRSFADLGLAWPNTLASMVPGSELVVAVVLLIEPGWGGVVSFGLLAAFTVVLANAIVNGRRVPCRCFGGTSDSPVSWRDVVRNLWLLLLAVTASTADSLSWPSPSAWVASGVLIAAGPVVMAVMDHRSKVIG